MSPIRISTDRLTASLEFDGQVQASDVDAELAEAGVIYGLDKQALEAALAAGASGESTCIARGLAPVPAFAARVELDFDVHQTIGTTDAQSLQIDYRERGGLQNVAVGDRLGVWYPEEEGTAGKGVDGQAVEPPQAVTPNASVGVDIRSEPGPGGSLVLFAEIAGVIRFGSSGDVYVSDLLEVDGDVDLAIGNIEVFGSVLIKGTVRSGFRVHAKQDIDVGQCVEDADIKAGKALRVGAGILAGGVGVVQAREVVRAKYTQNAILRCRGDVHIEADTNSTIECSGIISAREGAGRLRGGTYCAGVGVWATEIGSPQGVETWVRVGRDPGLARVLARVSSDLLVVQAKAKKLQRERGVESAKRVGQSLTREHAGAIRRAMKAQREFQKSRSLLETQRLEIEAAMAEADQPFVRVEKLIYSGVHLQIGDALLSIDSTRPGATFRRDAETGEVSSGS